MPAFDITQALKNQIERKESLTNSIMEALIAENPLLARLNADTLRSFVMKMMQYNTLPDEYFRYPGVRAPQCVTPSIVSLPIAGSVLHTLVNNDGQILKVCPSCKMTAHPDDPMCLGCSHIYENYATEAAIISATVDDILVEAGVRKGKGNIVLQDDVEGIVLTDRDIDKYMPNIDKYIPSC